ncbi:penicillin-binding protein [Marinicauda pacifica]|uniref:Penicillin-binding protein 1A n=1 Tax=Marinicauda pacifica TaxID=1133559 RepID=A0A4S2HFE6_9PROT|nr:penicillin-binding protein 1A [Marinicauda pacifica]TGY94382.1 penicillin-binding protein 1A [Marinicauda pacifica]GGE35345.1 penicillin-binding protein [Marinicauda pacifica]
MKVFTWKNALRTLIWGGATVGVLGVAAIIAVAVYVVRVTEDLPEYQQLAEYEPAIMSRVHAGDGLLIAEFARQQRVFVPIENIPPLVINAYLSAEDKNFYNHGGVDFFGMARGGLRSAIQIARGQGGPLQSGSTITQQVAKNFLFSADQRIERKVREIVISRRMERAFTKDQILELYLNEIYLGNRAYGVAAAALNYFGKSLDELDLHEAAYLAALPKGPSNYHPERERAAAIGRRNWVLERMHANGYITREEMNAAQAMPLESGERLSGSQYLAANYFVEQVRREVFDLYGEDQLYDGGLSIRTTLDTTMQLTARRALRNGLEAYDRRHGYRGPLTHFDSMESWRDQLAEFTPPPDLDETWTVAVVTGLSSSAAEVGLLSGERGSISLEALGWAREPLTREDGFPALGAQITAPSAMLSEGDVILVEPLRADMAEDAEDLPPADAYGLRQVPEVNGGIIAIDPYTGRVLAMVGGYSFEQSEFNRATQARRQPGSSFKPFVYAAALLNGWTPASIILDAPFVASGDSEMRFYRPQNYSNEFYGPSPLRLGLELSRNVMTVRLAQDLGLAPIVQIGEDFRLYDQVQPNLSMALGASETTLFRLVAAYSALVNGGRYIEPTLLDRVQSRSGETIYVHDQRSCEGCDVEEWGPEVEEPDLPVLGERVIDEVTAFQVVHMLEGVVERGTGARLRALGRPLGGKTGTTNDFRDAWFVGFGPDLIAATYVGFDTPRPLGSGEAGSRVAVPIVQEFLESALQDYPAAPFRVPEGVRFVPIDRQTGEPSVIGRPFTIMEAFKPGTEPTRGQSAAEESLSFGSGALGGRTPEEEPDSGSEEDEEDDLSGLY